MARWNPADHPRYPNGTFRPKLSQSVRLSPRSISYNAGVRVPVVPGRAQLYVGALVRVERVQGGDFMKRHVNRGVDKIATKFGDKGGRSNLARLIKGDDIQIKQYRIQTGGLRPATPNFRISSTPNSRQTFEVQERKASNERAPRRRPRVRSGVRPSTITTGISVQPPRAKRPRKQTRSSNRKAIGGSRVRR